MILIYTLSTSKHSPYRYKPDELWELPVDALFSVKDYVDIGEALEYSARTDQEDKAKVPNKR